MKIDKIYLINSVHSPNKTKQVSKPSFEGDFESPVNNLIEQRKNAMSVQSQAEDAIRYVDKFSPDTYKRQIEAKRQREIEEKGLNRSYKKIFSKEYDNVVAKWDKIFNEEIGKVRYIQTNRNFYLDVIQQSKALIAKLDVEIKKLTGSTIDAILEPLQVKPEKPTTTSVTGSATSRFVSPPVPYIPNVNGKSANQKTQSKITPTLENLKELRKKWVNLPNGDPKKQELGCEIYKIEERLKRDNVSFVPKPPATFASEEEKIEYIQSALQRVTMNDASAMDALGVFEKYGSRYTCGPYHSKNIDTGMDDLAVAIYRISDKFEGEITDKAISKYLDLFNKFARSDGEYTDTRHLRLLIERHHSKMSEETVMKLIDTLKKFSFEREQAWTVRRYILDNEFTKRSPEELSRIEKNIKELEEIVKDMPMKDKSKM